jgi:hypothetical protein
MRCEPRIALAVSWAPLSIPTMAVKARSRGSALRPLADASYRREPAGQEHDQQIMGYTDPVVGVTLRAMSQRLEDLASWRVGGSFATVAVIAWLFRLWGVALVLALIGAVLLGTAGYTRLRKRSQFLTDDGVVITSLACARKASSCTQGTSFRREPGARICLAGTAISGGVVAS